MDRIKAVLQCQWRAYWRRFRSTGNLSTNNLGLLVILGGIGVVRYLQQLPLAAAQLAKGSTARYETLLLLVFLIWLFPVMGESRRAISSRDLLHFPLSSRELFVIRLSSAFFSPLIWILVALSLALVYPIALARHPLIGIVALLTYLLLALFTSLTISHLLHNAIVRKFLLVALLVLSTAVGLLWLGRTGSAQSLRGILPNRLAAGAAVLPAPFGSLAVLVVVTAAFALLALWTFTLTLQPRQNRRSQKFTLFGLIQLPGRLGGLLKKDLRYSSRLLDLYLALPIVILFNIYLTSDPVPSMVVFAIIIGGLFWPCVGSAFNCFGLDSSLGLDRYTLLPLSGKEKLFSKNLAFATVIITLFVMLLPLTYWKLGPRASVLGLMELIVLVLAYVIYGNWMSVRQPFKMHFYRFTSGGSAVDVMMGMIFGSVPAAVAVYLLYHEDDRAFWKIGLMMLMYLALYFYSLFRYARVLEDHRETIRRALS